MGVCLDTGHAISTKRDLENAILAAGEYVICTHLHDAFKSYQMHLPPGEGLIDWKLAVNMLTKVGYSDRHIFELASGDASWEKRSEG